MFQSVFFEIAIGMVFIFLLYSLLATAIQEITATWLSLRGKYLRQSISVMLRDMHFNDTLADNFYNHPLIRKSIFKKHDKLPSYIAPDVFSKVLRDILPDLYLGYGKTLSDEEKIRLLPDGQLKKALLLYHKDGSQDFDKGVQSWFNDAMDRLTGAYKRNSQNRLLIIGLILAVFFNVNSLAVFDKLSKDKKARNELIAQAEKFMAENNHYDSLHRRFQGVPWSDSGISPTADDSLQKAVADSLSYIEFKNRRDSIAAFINGEINDANNAAGIGWGAIKGKTIREKLSNIQGWDFLFFPLGWLITALAITLGAPFWFDLLQKFIRIRGAGVRPPTDTEMKR